MNPANITPECIDSVIKSALSYATGLRGTNTIAHKAWKKFSHVDKCRALDEAVAWHKSHGPVKSAGGYTDCGQGRPNPYRDAVKTVKKAIESLKSVPGTENHIAGLEATIPELAARENYESTVSELVWSFTIMVNLLRNGHCDELARASTVTFYKLLGLEYTVNGVPCPEHVYPNCDPQYAPKA
jgi:hypothetical protein